MHMYILYFITCSKAYVYEQMLIDTIYILKILIRMQMYISMCITKSYRLVGILYEEAVQHGQENVTCHNIH